VIVDLTDPEIGKSFLWEQTPEGAVEPNVKDFDLVLRDRDSATLYVRFFVDGFPYQNAVDSVTVVDCTAAAGCSKPTRIKGLCDEVVNRALGTHFIEAYIVDQPWADNDKDLRKTQPGGYQTNVMWRFECIEPVETSDGGVS
jgi:hypothetical protein